MRVQIIGIGCNTCHRLEMDVISVVRQLGINAEIERIRDPEAILRFGLFALPGLAIDGKVIAAGYSGRHRVEKLLSEYIGDV